VGITRWTDRLDVRLRDCGQFAGVLLTAPTDDFDNAVLESIDEAIGALLGQEVLDALYSNLKTKRSIKREEIPDQLPILNIVLEEHFRSSTATIVRSIARNLYSKLGLNFINRKGYRLIDYVKDARNMVRLHQGRKELGRSCN
jgi:hypothetical protein